MCQKQIQNLKRRSSLFPTSLEGKWSCFSMTQEWSCGIKRGAGTGKGTQDCRKFANYYNTTITYIKWIRNSR